MLTRRHFIVGAAGLLVPDLSIRPANAFLADRVRQGGVAAIEVTDDGDSTLQSSGGGTSAHTHSSETSTGPDSILLITWGRGAGPGLDSATWGGNSVTLLVNLAAQSSRDVGTAIGHISGAQSGDVVLNFDDTVERSALTILSLANLQSATAIDTDTDTGVNSCTLAALSSPGVGGVRLAIFAHNETDAMDSWTNATEVSSFAVNNYRHSGAYDLGDDSGDITATSSNGGGGSQMVGVSLR